MVPRREKGRARERRKLIDPFVNLKRNVKLEVIHHEGVGAGCLRREGVSATNGGGALEGSWGEDFPQPQASEVVSFLTFHECGLGYPMHWFLCGLLNEWGLEL